MTKKRIAINTGGGDAPGLNAVIRAVVLSAKRRGWDVLGIPRGYEGLLDTSKIMPLDEASVRGITHLGGTILGTTNRGHPFQYPAPRPDGSTATVDRSGEALANFKKLGLDALVAIGGDGSLKIAKKLHDEGLPVVGVPKTIDNDLAGTDVTFGFDTAVSTAVDAIEKLHSTAEAHSRVFVAEVMGRYAGWIALNSGLASAADVILIPEIPFDIERVCQAIQAREAQGRHYSIVVASEGARPRGQGYITAVPADPGKEPKLGGVSALVADEIQKRTGKETRSLVLGHLQRGGSPTTFDRILALRFGAAAVEAVDQGKFGYMVALDSPVIQLVPIENAVARTNTVPLESDTISTARSLGVCLGD
jgi:ATP-dependent phosphofructokinase / diphosphate-dependent phosphofructokinase